jgi:hypothetical protein
LVIEGSHQGRGEMAPIAHLPRWRLASSLGCGALAAFVPQSWGCGLGLGGGALAAFSPRWSRLHEADRVRSLLPDRVPTPLCLPGREHSLPFAKPEREYCGSPITRLASPLRRFSKASSQRPQIGLCEFRGQSAHQSAVLPGGPMLSPSLESVAWAAPREAWMTGVLSKEKGGRVEIRGSGIGSVLDLQCMQSACNLHAICMLASATWEKPILPGSSRMHRRMLSYVPTVHIVCRMHRTHQ